MNILFLTLIDFQSLDERNIYTDLLREFVNNNHQVYVISPFERKKNLKIRLINYKTYSVLKVKIGNIQKTNVIEKGVSTLLLEYQYLIAIKKYFKFVKFDLVLYSTPPITLLKPIQYIKQRDKSKTYLLLKDIFPQNAVDMGMLKKKGLKGFLYSYFRFKEKKLYSLSDYIGCMSQANVDYILKHNPEINKFKIEICPNSIEPFNYNINNNNRIQLRSKFNLPINKTIFVYGGNLGKPQSIDYIIDCLKICKDINNVFFVIVGSGTEFNKIHLFLLEEKPSNIILLKQLCKKEYNELLIACDVGLIFLNHQFTIPNFPSRILDYMNCSLPVLATTDKNSDLGKVIEEGGFGFWCESNNINSFYKKICILNKKSIRKKIGINGKNYLYNNFTSKYSYNIIMNHFKNLDYY